MNSNNLKTNNEDENDLIIYDKEMIEHGEDPQDISFDEMMISLKLDQKKGLENFFSSPF